MVFKIRAAFAPAIVHVIIWSTFAAAADTRPTPRALGREFISSSVEAIAAPQAHEGDLNLHKALMMALQHNPELASSSWEVKSREAEVIQAGLRPNPELDVEVEGFAGSGEFSDFGAAETTLTFSQLIELGRKRKMRQASAALQQDLASWDYEAKRLDVVTETAKAFYAVLAAQERMAQAEELGRLAGQFHQVVSQRVASGKVSPLDQARAKVSLESAKIEVKRSQLTLAAARRQLSILWGGENPNFARAVGALEEGAPIPSVETIVVYLDQNPEIARWAGELEQRRAALGMAEAEGLPDLTVSLGVRNDQASGDNAFLAGFSIPLPFSNRNQGGIASARAALRQARYQHEAARNQAMAALTTRLYRLKAADIEVRSLQAQIIPAAEQALEAADGGYRAGKFGFLEVLDAQRTLFQVRGQYIDSLANYQEARIDVERLIGTSLKEIENMPDSGRNS